MTLSNNYIYWEVRSLKDCNGTHYGFAVMQPLPATPGEPERVYLLRRDGWWIDRAFHVSLPEKDRASVMFASLAEIAQLSHELGTKAKVVPAERFFAMLTLSQPVGDNVPRSNVSG